MNCDQWYEWILLNDSHELSSGKRRELQEHLNECASCRAFSADIAVLQDAARQPEMNLHVSDDIRNNILQEASEALEGGLQQTKLRLLRPAFIVPLAVAAALLLIVTWQVTALREQSPSLISQNDSPAIVETWDDTWDTEFAELEEAFLLAGIQQEIVETNGEFYDTETIAQELLEMEES